VTGNFHPFVGETDDHGFDVFATIHDEMPWLADDLSLDPGALAAVPEVVEADSWLEAREFIGMCSEGIRGYIQ